MLEASFPVRLAGGVPVVAAPDEIDITNAGLLRAALLAAGGNGNGNRSRTVVVDMSGTSFCDSAALNVLVRAHQRALADGGELRLVLAGSGVMRIFVVTGIDQMIPIFASLDEALSRPAEELPAPPVSLRAGRRRWHPSAPVRPRSARLGSGGVFAAVHPWPRRERAALPPHPDRGELGRIPVA